MKKVIITLLTISFLSILFTACDSKEKAKKLSILSKDHMDIEQYTETDTENSTAQILAEGNNDYDTAMELYQEFLAGQLSIDYMGSSLDMNTIMTPTGEPDRSYFTKYAYYDSDGDTIPELHICSARYYYVLTCRDHKLLVWKDLSPYPCYYALNDGAFISWDQRAGYERSAYYIFDYDGTEKYSVGFSRYDIDNDGEWEETDEYNFNGDIVTQETWEELTAPYLNSQGGVREDIQNQIDWTVMEEGITIRKGEKHYAIYMDGRIFIK